MRRMLRPAGFAFALLLLAPAAPAAETPAKSGPSASKVPAEEVYASKETQVEAVADQLEYDREKKIITARGNVVVHYQNLQITADQAEVETETKRVHAKGHVIFFKNGTPVAKSDEVDYNFDTQTGSFPDGRAIAFPWFIHGRDVRQVRKGVKEITDGSLTTCDLERPHYAVRASRITVYDNDKMVARNIKIVVLDKPIFWFPYLIIPLQPGDNIPISATVGYNSRHGFYIELTKGTSFTKNIWAKYHLDERTRRGVGGGSDLFYDFGDKARGIVKGYITKDDRAPNPTAEDPYGSQKEQDRTRGRITYLHRTDFQPGLEPGSPQTHLIGRYNRFSDEFFLQDFFQRESRAEIEPQSFVTLSRTTNRYGLVSHVEKRMNRFESLVQRLPELRADWKNQPFLGHGIFFESQASYANLSKVFGRSNRNEDVNRFDQFNEWSRPMTWEHIHVTPLVNARGTIYSRRREDDEARFRGVVGAGADLHTQLYKTWSASFNKAGIEANGIRHVLEPSLEYVARTSTLSDEKLNRFDAIDRLDDAQILTFGVENRIQTKRVVNGRMQRVDLVSLNTFLSYELYPDGRALGSRNFEDYEEDDRSRSAFTVLSQQIVLRPYEWLQYEARFDYDMERHRFRVANQDFLAKAGRWKFLFGHRYIRRFVEFPRGNQFVFETGWTLNALWSLGGYVRFDPNRGSFDEWQLSATRDLHDFLLDFGYNARESAVSGGKEIYFNFRLKAFPEYALRSGHTASFSEPRIGETVAGANQSLASRALREIR